MMNGKYRRFVLLSALIVWVVVCASPAEANITFTATNFISESNKKITTTVQIQDCAFDDALIGKISILGKPVGVINSDPAIFVSAGQQGCYLYKKYLVTTLDTTEQVGEHILVQLNEGNRNDNRFKDMGHWFVAVPNEGHDNNWFHGIYKHFLFVDDGCCLGPRGLDIYDLDTKKKIWSTLCSDPVIDRDNHLSYWVEEKENASRDECPDKEYWINSPPAIERKVELDLETLILSKTSETICAARQ